jgi:hypothetical protein
MEDDCRLDLQPVVSQLIDNLPGLRSCSINSRAICTDILHFSARLLVVQAARSCSRASTLIEHTVLHIDSATWGPGSSGFASGRTGPRGPRGWKPLSVLHFHAAASADGHVPHDADRLA